MAADLTQTGDSLLANDMVWSELENFETFREKEHLPASQDAPKYFASAILSGCQ